MKISTTTETTTTSPTTPASKISYLENIQIYIFIHAGYICTRASFSNDSKPLSSRRLVHGKTARRFRIGYARSKMGNLCFLCVLKLLPGRGLYRIANKIGKLSVRTVYFHKYSSWICKQNDCSHYGPFKYPNLLEAALQPRLSWSTNWHSLNSLGRLVSVAFRKIMRKRLETIVTIPSGATDIVAQNSKPRNAKICKSVEPNLHTIDINKTLYGISAQ